ncbi:MAG: hypothetical protein V3W18_10455, partial [candidate division Zixibacteria bacterium]
MKKLLTIGIAIMLIGVFMVACDENTTDPNPILGTVTFNLSAPWGEEVVGVNAAVSLWSTWESNTPVLIEDGVYSSNSLTIQIPDVEEGTYIAVAVIDANGDGFSIDGPANEGDVFWAGLDVAISGNKTISVTSQAWQYIDTNSVIIGVKGIPAGLDGEVFASGIFPDGSDLFTNPDAETYNWGVGYVYNNSCVLALNPDIHEDPEVVDLPSGSYDIWMLVDVDGTIENWYDTTGMDEEPITNGDYLGSFDYVYDALDYNAPLINATFTEMAMNTLTFNITVPAGENLDGNSAMAFLFTDPEADGPSHFDEALISGGTATITFEVSAAWAMLGAVILDVDGNGFDSTDSGPPMDPGDLFWGALNLTAANNLVVDIPVDGWQDNAGYHFVAVEGIPAGHDGEVLSVGFVADADNPFNPYSESNYMGGAGLIYNNSTIISMHSMGYSDQNWELPYGSYDIYCLMDIDGSISDYENMDDSTMFNPVTYGDRYYKYDYTYTEMQATDDFVHLTGTFSPVVGISGTVSCPEWQGGAGGTYVYLFDENPILVDSAYVYSGRALTQP